MLENTPISIFELPENHTIVKKYNCKKTIVKIQL